jgi:hypothetical protein
MMIGKTTGYGFWAIAWALLLAPSGVAQDSAGQAVHAARDAEASGTFAPAGQPLGPPVRVEAGGSCIIDLKQAYKISGTLSGTLDIDYRIIVYGPCEVPPIPGKYDEQWIAHGTFMGTVDGAATSGNLSYTAQVRAGGAVEGRMVLRGGLGGELAVSGNFGDGQLAYRGRLK